MFPNVFAPNLLAGKSALVTGGGSGIGAGIARLFAQHGAKVALVGRTAQKLETTASAIKEAGGVATIHPCDVRDYPALETAINDAADANGGLDVLVNSAAGNFLAPAATLSANGFRAVVDIDLCGTFNACRAAFAHLSKRGGSIVSITATQADVPTPLQCHVGAAKAGIAKLTRDLALEWSKLGIRVTAIAPGPIEGTEGMSRLAPGDAEQQLKSRVPLGRYGTIEEVANATLFLVSPASAYITGTTLLIDGGTSLIGPGPFLEMMGF
ncbi:MAG: short-chain dehydrogenase [Myxococcales bacterium 68-20]|nr:SDR family oxidoreductase [Myxococcales bacterium]OJY26012.1 MAG: short-chain dehydrogenase [Myxococcales bacterium 68-20]